MHARIEKLVESAGMRGVAHASMTSLDGASTMYRDKEAAAKARASLDFSSLSDRAAKGARPPPYQRAQSADIHGKSQHKHQQVVHHHCVSRACFKTNDTFHVTPSLMWKAQLAHMRL